MRAKSRMLIAYVSNYDLEATTLSRSGAIDYNSSTDEFLGQL